MGSPAVSGGAAAAPSEGTESSGESESSGEEE